MKILIIGAGIAGLAAADYLKQKNYDVKILEAENRIGGRTWTSHDLSAPIDRGATWIHGIDQNPMTDLAIRAGVRLKLCEFTRQLFVTRDKKILSVEQCEYFFNFFEKYFAEAIQTAKTATQELSILDAILTQFNPEKEDIATQDQWRWFLKRLALYSGGDAGDLSARHADEEISFTGGHHILLDGFEKIVTELAKSSHIILNQPVKKIMLRDDRIEVITQNGSETADAVIVTVPLGVLKKSAIDFEPALPQNKLLALQRLKMGLLNKIVMQFPKRFWPNDYVSFNFANEKQPSLNHFFNYAHFCEQPILAAHVGGSEAWQLEEWSDEALIESALDGLRSYFGSDVPHPEKYFVTRWGQHPWSFGSYSYLSLGASGEDFDALAEPIANRIFFAGEATSRHYFGTTHGAYLSGLREAQRIE